MAGWLGGCVAGWLGGSVGGGGRVSGWGGRGGRVGGWVGWSEDRLRGESFTVTRSKCAMRNLFRAAHPFKYNSLYKKNGRAKKSSCDGVVNTKYCEQIASHEIG